MQFRASNSAIVHGFQAFYYELLRQKEVCLSKFASMEDSSCDPDVHSTAIISNIGQSSSEVEGMIVGVQKKLIMTIEKVFEIISSKSRISNKKMDEAKYIMTVLADEIFINMKWDGAKFWRFSLLEKQIFKSEIAGEKFFTMLDEMITNLNELSDEMTFLYLMALSLGFKGKYRGGDTSEEYLSWYRDKLYSMLHKKTSRLFYPGRANMIESCYEYTISENSNQFLPDTRFWAFCIVGIIFVYIVVSYAVWFGITDEISDVLKAIAEQIKRGPLV